MALSQSLRFALVVLWIVLSALQYGFHISALNSSQESVICSDEPLSGTFGLPTCIPMTTFGFGVVTASYTLGGFASSLLTGRLADAKGRKQTALYSAWLIVLGGVAMTFGSSISVLVIGRVLIGAACGIATVLVPLYLSEVAPPAIRGNIGVLTQLSICFGILLAQSISIPLSEARTGKWRLITLVSMAIALLQIATAPLMVDSAPGKDDNGPVYDVVDEERAPLAGNEEDGETPDYLSRGSSTKDDESSMTLAQVYRSKDPAVRSALWTMVLSQLFQQWSGVNGVLYYSVGILTAVNPSNAKAVAVFITLVNFVMTLPAVYLIDRLGRRSLILGSMIAMSASAVVLGYSINSSRFLIASTCIVLFIASFSVGLGPIPFVLMGEVPPVQARSATASAALGVNWLSNFCVGLTFLPLRNWLSGSGGKDGQVFYLFAVIIAVGVVVLGRRIPSSQG
ncbi:general substrate transporter [Leucosporidium creatinivorum]|uniref:General substrate transporter n=1 Tax=Leucosporidium creatinivorum TaxID=106004 RepID=A0A1Y2FEG8_9BASI|nr:general substrate transporter [Leucosporidium creatinivorum]